MIRISVLIFLLFAFLNISTNCETVQKKVYLIPVTGVVDLGLSGFIKRSTEEAKKSDAKAVIFELDTPGGRVDAAEEILEYIRSLKPILTIAFINDEASSAGAFISFGCDKIVMAPGSSIGSAEPRTSIGPTSEGTDEKYVSDFRSKFKSIAEENNHSGNLAQKMVDKDIELKKVKIKGEDFILTTEELEEKKKEFKEEDIVIEAGNIGFQKGKLLNLTAKDAVELKLAEAELKTKEEILSYFGLKDSVIIGTSPNWSEGIVRFLTHPIVSSLLMTLGFLGLIFEVTHPGWTLPGTIALVCLALFFWGHYLVGLANLIEILMFIAGVGLLLLEIFVMPGFGIPGITGIILIIGGLFLALIKSASPFQAPKVELMGAFYIMAWSFAITLVSMVLLIRFLPQSGFWKRVALTTSEEKTGGYRADTAGMETLIGKVGRTVSILRPSGRAVFGDKILDVITEGDFIETEKEVRVVRVDGNRIVVSKV